MLTVIEKRGLQDELRVKVVTDVSLANLVQGSTDITALVRIMERIRQASVIYLPRIHAKVYVSGSEFALITSANFTEGGSHLNLEYGVIVHDPKDVSTVNEDIERYANLGGTLTLRRLRELDDRVTELKAAIREERSLINAKLREAAARLQRETEDQLLMSRIEGRSIHAVFVDTILYLLASGPMTTVQLHERIQHIHPDLCDDSLDRVIGGQHFGKLWKHYVRTAQQDLKRNDMITYDRAQRLWALSSRA